ncbi:MAG: flagellar basal body L-ring protein FlgH [Balneolaceae bacterium]|nr:flagellar basal body L-ring protein FlgH [Balneolaceae bacterium]
MAKNTITHQILLITLFTALFISGTAVAQNSLYKDVKANQVGDIITVILKESTSGSSTSDSKLSSRADGQASGSLSGNFLPFEPTFGSGATVNYGSDRENLSRQRQLLEGFISVQIVEVTDRGDLIVEGSRQTEVNGEVHEMSLAGTVRQNDVDSRNQVLSYRIANADISYQKKGGIFKKKQDRGFLKKVVFTGISLGLGAAVIMRQLNK